MCFMNYLMYEMMKSDLKGARDITGYFDFFNPSDNKISKYKLIFILPNGKCLLIPYASKDNGRRKQFKYNHIVYITKSIELILKELNMNKEEFIQQKVKAFDSDELIAAILKLNIPIFYDTGYYDSNGNRRSDNIRYTIFEKTIKFTEKQEKTLLTLKEAFRRENYSISIQVLNSDDTLINREKCIGVSETDEDSALKWVFHGYDGNLDFDVDDFYRTIKVSNEQIL